MSDNYKRSEVYDAGFEAGREAVIKAIKESRAAIFQGLAAKDGKLYAQIEITDGSPSAFLVTANTIASLATSPEREEIDQNEIAAKGAKMLAPSPVECCAFCSAIRTEDDCEQLVCINPNHCPCHSKEK